MTQSGLVWAENKYGAYRQHIEIVLLYSLVAGSKAPADYEISVDALSVEPYGIMLRKDDPAFKKVVDDAMIAAYKSGEINKIYDNWPTDSADPKDYQ